MTPPCQFCGQATTRLVPQRNSHITVTSCCCCGDDAYWTPDRYCTHRSVTGGKVAAVTA